MRLPIAFAMLVACSWPLHAAERGALYVTKDGLDCVVAKSGDYLAGRDETVSLSMQACLHDMSSAASERGLDSSGTGKGGGGSGGGLGSLPQTVGGASRTAEDSNLITATDHLTLRKNQLRCLVAKAATLPVVKDAFGNAVVRIDTLACMTQS